MIVINELRITPDNKNIIIDASVDNLCYYKDVGIAAIIIDTKDTYSNSQPSNRAVYHLSLEDVEKSTSCDGKLIQYDNDRVKRVRLTLDKSNLGVDISDNIFFVYLIANGIPAPETPCGYDNIYTMGVVYNMKPFYDIGMNYIKELSNNCVTPRGFIDYILRYKAFQLSMKTGNYVQAIDYWNNLLRVNNHTIQKYKGCGCHGNY